MAATDRERWNQRYAQEGYDFAASAWLSALDPRMRPRWPGARALDLASGGGRHALHLARLGYRVDAWDISDVALRFLRSELEQRAIAGEPLPVDLRLVDLERAPIPAATYDLILDAQYLDRALFASLARALRPGGLLIVRTFLYVAGGPITSGLSNAAYALRPGELGSAFAGLELLDLVEDAQAEQAHLLARKPLGGVHNARSVSGGQ